MTRRRFLVPATALTGATALVLGLTACAGSDDSPADNGGVRIVASTSVWGDIAQQVVDDAESSGADLDVTVDTILSSTDDDPHEYEATARDVATIRDADIVVGNGAGYDNWLTDNAGDDADVITAAPIGEGHDHSDHADHDHGDADHDHSDSSDADHADHDHGDGGLLESDANPHVWFDMDDVTSFADDLAAALHDLDDTFPSEASGVHEMTDDIRSRLADLPHAHAVLTEPVAGLLLKGTEIHDVTPAGYAQTVLNEGEPSAADLSATRDLITGGDVDVLITNTQSQSQTSGQLTDAAKDRNVPLVNVTETPADGQSYQDYVDDVITDLEDALK